MVNVKRSVLGSALMTLHFMPGGGGGVLRVGVPVCVCVWSVRVCVFSINLQWLK